MNETQKKAIEKIYKEIEEFKGDKYGQVIYKPVAEALKQFCDNERFAAAILESDKTLSDCCKDVTKGVTKSLSDIDAYRKAVQFYFPEANVKFDMRIILSGEDLEKTVETLETLKGDLPEISSRETHTEHKIISLFDIL